MKTFLIILAIIAVALFILFIYALAKVASDADALLEGEESERDNKNEN